MMKRTCVNLFKFFMNFSSSCIRYIHDKSIYTEYVTFLCHFFNGTRTFRALVIIGVDFAVAEREILSSLKRFLQLSQIGPDRFMV
jgi:hypothetical protein